MKDSKPAGSNSKREPNEPLYINNYSRSLIRDPKSFSDEDLAYYMDLHTDGSSNVKITERKGMYQRVSFKFPDKKMPEDSTFADWRGMYYSILLRPTQLKEPVYGDKESTRNLCLWKGRTQKLNIGCRMKTEDMAQWYNDARGWEENGNEGKMIYLNNVKKSLVVLVRKGETENEDEMDVIFPNPNRDIDKKYTAVHVKRKALKESKAKDGSLNEDCWNVELGPRGELVDLFHKEPISHDDIKMLTELEQAEFKELKKEKQAAKKLERENQQEEEQDIIPDEASDEDIFGVDETDTDFSFDDIADGGSTSFDTEDDFDDIDDDEPDEF